MIYATITALGRSAIVLGIIGFICLLSAPFWVDEINSHQSKARVGWVISAIFALTSIVVCIAGLLIGILWIAGTK